MVCAMRPRSTWYFPFENVAPLSPCRCLRCFSSCVLSRPTALASIRLIHYTYYWSPCRTAASRDGVADRHLVPRTDFSVIITAPSIQLHPNRSHTPPLSSARSLRDIPLRCTGRFPACHAPFRSGWRRTHSRLLLFCLAYHHRCRHSPTIGMKEVCKTDLIVSRFKTHAAAVCRCVHSC